MVVKELMGGFVAILVLAGIAYTLYRGDASVKLLGQAGDSLSNVIVAATPRGA